MIKNEIIKCMNNIGIIIAGEESENFMINKYIEDSVSYVSLIIEIEQEFNIEVMDEYFIVSNMETMNDLCNMIENIQNKQKI